MRQYYNSSCIILLALYLLPYELLFAQNALDFQSPNEVCQDQYFDVKDISAGYLNTQLDFCEGDLSLAPTLTVKQEPSFNVPIGTSLIHSNGKWYGFVCSMNDNAIFRLDFGASLTNKSPDLVKLNSTGGLLNFPQDIKVMEYEGEFLAFIYNRNGNQLVRLNFGASIENINVTADALLSGNGYVNGGLDVIFDGKQWTASLTYKSQIRLINLGDSPKNVPGSSDIITTNPIGDIDGIGDINFIQDNGQWYGFVVGFNSRTIHRLDFGDSLFIEPTSHKYTSFELGSMQPRGITIKRDKREWFFFVVTQQGNFLRFNLGENIVNDNPLYTDLGNLGNLNNTYKFDMANSSSRWVALTTSWNTNRYHLIEFPQADCPFDLEYSESETVSLKALKQGTQHITLYGQDNKGLHKQVSNQIFVTNNQAPNINFVVDNLCLDNPTTFSAQNLTPSQTLTSYTWDFGDGTTATGEEATHQYTAPGIYKVRLTVEADGGCGNFIEKEINIYEVPEPEFIFPDEVLCTNGAIAFENLTPGDYNDDITWLWDFGDGTTSAEKHPSHTYVSGGTKTVTLTASIPGCSATISHTLEVIEGPSVDFSAANLCFGEEVEFTNLTLGDDITGYSWDFGNGEISSEISPTTTFSEPGAYAVSLTVTTASGCNNTMTKTITIRDLPQVNFVHAMSCSGIPTAFEDRSTVAEGSISSWLWDFGDGHTSTQKNPSHAFEGPGTYEVKLIATSSFGCVDSTVQTVLVKAAPKADFNVEVGCLGTLSRFTDTSIVPDGDEIVNRVWIINSATFYSKNPEVPFTQPGTYDVKLSITSSNGCVSTITKTIVVDPLPTVDFDFSNACVGEQVAFRDLSQVSGGEQIVEWHWQFGGIATSNEQHPEVVFAQAGNVLVTLTVTTDRGCSESILRTIAINGQPQAAFSVNQYAGAPPLQVNFTNNSIGAVSYQWLFGDQENSATTEQSPTFTYEGIGRFEAKLVAINAAGCSDTASVFIETLDPEMDLAVDALNVFTIAGDIQAVMKLTNKGSIAIRDFDILMDLGGQVSLKEKFSGEIVAGETINYPLSIRLSEQEAARVPYICVTLMLDETGFAEVDAENNKACKEISKEFVLLSPYPNPVEDWVYLSFVMPERQPVTLTVMNNLGKVVEDKALANTKVGLNEYKWDLTTLPAGSYVLKVKYKDSVHLRKVVIR